MTNSNRRTVCLLGPIASGKSSLLRTIKQCVRLRSHGYQPAYIPSLHLTEISETDFNAGFASFDSRILTRFPAGKYATEEDVFFKREKHPEEPTRPHEGAIKYFFSLDCGLAPDFAETLQGDPEKYLVQVVDAAGELSTASGSAGEETEDDLEDKRVILEEILMITDGVILVVPPADGAPEDWSTYTLGALEKLARIAADKARLQQIIVVFSQYDRLFLHCGKDAADIAVRQDTVLHTIKREFQTRAWLQRFATLNHKVRGIEIRFTVASALGFVRLFGNANVDPHAKPFSFSRFEANGPNGPDAAPLWRPFLTVDPFVFAATGHPNGYMYTLDEIGIAAPMEPEYRQEPEQQGFAEHPDNPFQGYDESAGPSSTDTADKQPPLLRRLWDAILEFFTVRK